jgi:hypothetical protein
MAIVGISHKIQSTLAHLHGSGGDVATKAHLRELGDELLELAEAVERLSMEVDRLADGRGRYEGGPPRS